ncbi:MAG: hypothetical protein GF353_18590 [Candidatus Lokiarchaeota archaeon]|nr:hypothetical protein [Candidatus Lokiarchaeota archaeon]
MTELKQTFELDSIVSTAVTDLEKARLICDWVHSLWEHDGVNKPQNNDPISIINETNNGKRFRCVEFSIVIQGCLTALEIPSRIVVLMTKDVETSEKWASHYVVEAFLKNHEKWCMIDGQRNAIPVLGDVPLNAIEFQAALANKQKDLRILNLSDVSTPPYFRWISPSLYYFQYNVDNRIAESNKDSQKIMLVPIGAKEPKVFQRKSSIKNVIYSNSLLNIYHRPEP